MPEIELKYVVSCSTEDSVSRVCSWLPFIYLFLVISRSLLRCVYVFSLVSHVLLEQDSQGRQSFEHWHLQKVESSEARGKADICYSAGMIASFLTPSSYNISVLAYVMIMSCQSWKTLALKSYLSTPSVLKVPARLPAIAIYFFKPESILLKLTCIKVFLFVLFYYHFRK